MGQFPCRPERIPSDGIHPIHPNCGDLEVRGRQVHLIFRADSMQVYSVNPAEVCILVRVVGSDNYYLMQMINRHTQRQRMSLCRSTKEKLGDEREDGVDVKSVELDDDQPIGLVKFERVMTSAGGNKSKQKDENEQSRKAGDVHGRKK
jgi:hypothetical protein